MFFPGIGIFQNSQKKRSSVSSVLQPIVATVEHCTVPCFYWDRSKQGGFCPLHSLQIQCLVFTVLYLPFLAGKYRTQLFDEAINDFLPASPGIGMHVEVKDPNSKVILSKYYSSEGRFTFTSHTPGEHVICLHSNSTRWSLWAGGKLVSCWHADKNLPGSRATCPSLKTLSYALFICCSAFVNWHVFIHKDLTLFLIWPQKDQIFCSWIMALFVFPICFLWMFAWCKLLSI